MSKYPKWVGLFAIIVALAICGARAEAQQQAKIPKIGWLGIRAASSDPARESFRREFRALGYVDGKNIVFEYRSADDKIERLSALADELVRLKVDVLVAWLTPAAVAAKNATRTIPIVFNGGFDPVALELVDSLARPGGNITGFTSIASVLAGKRLELLKEVIPKLSRVAVIWDPQNPGSAQQWKESQLPARELEVQLHSIEVSSVDKFEAAFKEAIKSGSGALALMASPFFYSNQKQFVELAAKNRLAAIYPREEFITAGGLISYGSDGKESFRRVASMVDKILKGAKPADLPVEQPTKFELVINLKTAKEIGVMIPQSVLYKADKVIR
jgi:putative tryptophan/tyrosine transport system substrate-binding protein